MITRENLQKLQKSLPNGVAALVLSEANRFYLTGFPSSSGFCLLTASERLFYTDSRYIEAAKNTVAFFEVKQETGGREHLLCELLKSLGIKKLHLEITQTTMSTYLLLKRTFAFAEIDLSGHLDRLLLSFRKIKTPDEVALMERAAQISEKSFTELLPNIRVGQTERELAAKLEYLMKTNGGDGLAFETIAVTGKNSSKPHGVPGDTAVSNGDFITFDFGAAYKGYLSDMTRTVAVGSVTDEMKRVYDTVLTAQLAGLDAIRVGKKCDEVDRVSRTIISDAGYGDCFGHGLGHSVGIEIHESPRLSPTCADLLEEGMIVTCEPGIYLEGKFGVRIEDTVLVTKNGAKPLHKVTKELIIL